MISFDWYTIFTALIELSSRKIIGSWYISKLLAGVLQWSKFHFEIKYQVINVYNYSIVQTLLNVFKRVENAKRWNEVCFGEFDMQMCHSLTHSGVDTLRN